MMRSTTENRKLRTMMLLLKTQNKRMNDILYVELSKALDAEAKAENSFAKYYDTNSLLAAKTRLRKAINSSDADGYYDSSNPSTPSWSCFY